MRYRRAQSQPPGVLRKSSASSSQRYAQVEELLKSRSAPFVVEDFIRFSEDRNNSIWRTGSTPNKTRTLATWLVSIPATGSPQLYFEISNPGKPEWVCRLSVEDALRGDDRNTILQDSDLCRGKGPK